MSMSPSMRAQRARQTADRINAALSFARAVCFLAVVYSLVAIPFYGLAGVSWKAKTGGILLAILTASTAWVGTYDGRWTNAARGALAMFLASIGWFSFLLYDRGLRHEVHTSMSAMIALAGGAALLLLAQLVRVRASAGVSMCVIALAFGFFGVETLFRRLDQPPVTQTVAGIVPPPGGRDEKGQIVDFVPTQVEWSAGVAQPHPITEYQYLPGSTQKNYYPNNPENYFDIEPVGDHMDHTVWRMVDDNGGNIHRFADSRSGPFGFEINRPAEDRPESVRAQNIVRVVAGEYYVVMIKVRSTPARKIGLAVANPDDYQRIADREWWIGSEDQWITLPFRAPEGLYRAMIQLSMGSTASEIDVETCICSPCRQPGFGRVDMRTVELITDGDTHAGLVDPSPDRVTVRIDGPQQSGDASKPFASRVFLGRYRLESGRAYTISASVRTSEPKEIFVQAYGDAPPWTEVGPRGTWPVGTEWSRYEHTFTASATLDHAMFHAMMGGRSQQIEWKDVSIRPADAPVDLAQPFSRADRSPRYSMGWRNNSMGFRDREHALEKPAKTFRIALMGDSLTLGQGVRMADRYGELLEQRFRDLFPADWTVEVLNFGVCGYATWQERACYESIARKYDPDLVTLVMHPNDVRSPREDKEWAEQQAKKEGTGFAIADRFLHSVQSEGFGRCIDEIKKLDGLVREDGARLAVFAWRDSTHESWTTLVGQVGPALASADIPFYDLGKVVSKDHRYEELIVAEVDQHPNRLSHRLAAQAIGDFLLDQGMVPLANRALESRP